MNFVDVLHVASVIAYAMAAFLVVVVLVVWCARKKFNKPAPKTRTVYRHRLTVQYKNGERATWSFARDENHGPVELWKPFVRWWYGQPHKQYFAVQVPGRHIMLNRENIVLFELRVVEAEEEA